MRALSNLLFGTEDYLLKQITDVHVEMKHQEWIKKSRKCAATAPQSLKYVVKCDVHKENKNTNKPDVKNCPESDVLEEEVTKQETTPSHDVHEETSDDSTNKTDGEESPNFFYVRMMV